VAVGGKDTILVWKRCFELKNPGSYISGTGYPWRAKKGTKITIPEPHGCYELIAILNTEKERWVKP